MADQTPITIKDIYPHLPDEQLKKAHANLRAYLAVVIRIAERLAAEGKSINDEGDLTTDELTTSMQATKVETDS